MSEEKAERIDIQLIVTTTYPKLTHRVNLGTRGAEKVKLTQKKLFTKADLRAIATGKPAPARPVRITLSYLVPTEVVAKRMRRYGRLAQRRGMEA